MLNSKPTQQCCHSEKAQERGGGGGRRGDGGGVEGEGEMEGEERERGRWRGRRGRWRGRSGRGGDGGGGEGEGKMEGRRGGRQHKCTLTSAVIATGGLSVPEGCTVNLLWRAGSEDSQFAVLPFVVLCQEVRQQQGEACNRGRGQHTTH